MKKCPTAVTARWRENLKVHQGQGQKAEKRRGKAPRDQQIADHQNRGSTQLRVTERPEQRASRFKRVTHPVKDAGHKEQGFGSAHGHPILVSNQDTQLEGTDAYEGNHRRDPDSKTEPGPDRRLLDALLVRVSNAPEHHPRGALGFHRRYFPGQES